MWGCACSRTLELPICASAGDGFTSETARAGRSTTQPLFGVVLYKGPLGGRGMRYGSSPIQVKAIFTRVTAGLGAALFRCYCALNISICK